VPLPLFADAVAPGIVVAQAIGRIGNYFNQELYGKDTTLPWGLEIYKRVAPDGVTEDPLGGVATSHIPIHIAHPTFLYELLWNLLVAGLVIWADRRFRLGHGRAFALYVAGYTAGRTWIELLRVDDATHVFGVRINVFVSIIVFLAAVAYFVWAKRLGPREVLEPEPEELTDGAEAEAEPDGEATSEKAEPEKAEDAGGQSEAAEPKAEEPANVSASSAQPDEPSDEKKD
jgi:prolipoprotein diacylglyceryltransferase